MAVTATLAAVAIAHWVTGACFGVVAMRLSQQLPHGPARSAARGFVLWWGCLGAYMVVEGFVAAVGAFTDVAVLTYLGTRIVSIPLLVVATWGLVTYLAYIYLGTARLARPLGLVYTGVGVLFAYAVWTQPRVLASSEWLVRLEGTGEGWAYRLIYLAIGVPALVGTIAYAALLPRLSDPAQRFRVAFVSLGLFAWVGSGLIAQLGSNDLLKFFTVVPMGLLAGLLVLRAYHPRRPRDARTIASASDEAPANDAPAPNDPLLPRVRSTPPAGGHGRWRWTASTRTH